MRIRAKERQTLVDIGLQNGGSVASGMETAIRNGLSMSAELEDGQELEVTGAAGVAEKRTVRRYEVEGVEPATEVSAGVRGVCPYGGIGYMGIEMDFCVT